MPCTDIFIVEQATLLLLLLVVVARWKEERFAVQNVQVMMAGGQVLIVQSENVLVQQGLLPLAHGALERGGEVGISTILAEPFRGLHGRILAANYST